MWAPDCALFLNGANFAETWGTWASQIRLAVQVFQFKGLVQFSAVGAHQGGRSYICLLEENVWIAAGIQIIFCDKNIKLYILENLISPAQIFSQSQERQKE